MTKTAKIDARLHGEPVKVGAITYKSIAAAARANGVSYGTMYMRLKVYKWTAGNAANRKVRKYVKKTDTPVTETVDQVAA